MANINDVEKIHSFTVYKDDAFLDFEAFVEDQEKSPYLRRDGAIQVTVDSSIRELNLKNNDAVNTFLSECVSLKQEVNLLKLQQHHRPGFWHYNHYPTSNEDLFWKRIRQEHRYRIETCCLKKLEQGTGDLLDHYFEHVLVKHSLHELSDESRSYWEKVSKKGQSLLEEYMAYKHEGKTIFSIDKNATSIKGCECIECKPSLFKKPLPGACNVSHVDSSSKNVEEEIFPEEKGFWEDGPLYGHGEVPAQNCIQITKNLSLSKLGTMLNLFHILYPGLGTTFLYFAALHAFFPLHVEDALLWSVNFLHLGAPKVWIILPPRAIDLLNFHLDQMKMGTWTSSCCNKLGHKVFVPSVTWLKARNIPFKVAIQFPGDLIILHPNAAHYGFNLGYNIAEAVNFATKSWIPYGINAQKCLCFHRPIHLDMGPFVEAFRKDLLDKYLNNDFIPTPDLRESLSLMTKAVASLCNDSENPPNQKKHHPYASKVKARLQCQKFSCTIACPMLGCDMTFKKLDRTAISSHVRSKHLPFIQSHNLFEKIDGLFESKSQRK